MMPTSTFSAVSPDLRLAVVVLLGLDVETV